jgi:predicted DNA-binding transcriptional regulator AlpA
MTALVADRSHHQPPKPTKNRYSVWGGMRFHGGMPKPLPRVPSIEPTFILRRELLTLVPHSMATIDRLEAGGKFPKRIRLEPTNRVAWLRREVLAYLRRLVQRSQSSPQEHQDKSADREQS